MPAATLLCTDFDGTLVDPFSHDQCTEEFSEKLAYHHHAGGIWVINTGRSFTYTLEGLERFQSPISPDYIIALEREIYRLTHCGQWKYFGRWNKLGQSQQAALMLECQDSLRAIYQQALRHRGVKIVHEQGVFVGLIIPEENTMHRFILWLEEICKHCPKFSYQRNTIHLRFSHADYHKGSTLAELCRLIKLSREVVLAIGDNFNDLPMLNGKTAAMCACPANAIDAVKQSVLQVGGFVASKAYSAGVVEAFEHFIIPTS